MDEMRKRGCHLVQYFCQCGGVGNLNQWHKRVLILRALVCKNHTNSKFRSKGEKFDFSLILILDRLKSLDTFFGKMSFYFREKYK